MFLPTAVVAASRWSIVRRQRHQQRRGRLGQQVIERRRIGGQHLRHARQLRRRLRRAASRPLPATSACTSPSFCAAATALRDGCLMPAASNSSRTSAVIGQITFASVRSFATSSATEPTFTPALRFGGSATFSVVSRGAGSTPRSAGFTFSIGFLRAFMMLGSEA